MATENFVQQLASILSQGATVKNVFGEPIQAGDKTIVPVARIAYGFGGGFGQGKRPKKETSLTEQTAEGEGGGGGGGLKAQAKGVYEISPAGVRFISASPGKLVFIGAVIGFALKALLSSKHKGHCRMQCFRK
ncbi:GerW family sporulation protein [Flavisolibacter ginsenosidimutans]|uniref:Sporulation protein n=1 Tax=Flavisolibacter ginsenosidimutans TaxID=661481 RepID=A0A5B8UML0_9BACT|nr:spore germination protein GerW family protein [Flavisolibacter ginsenosidimutans]QEC57917.1 hypothetical protein FSB75_19070 [Flavisolibacter ginsenosidimutans]